jgi:hypothetical protein
MADAKCPWNASGDPYNPLTIKTGRRTTMPVEDLRQSEMMSHLLDALNKGEDIGHYGRLTFAMVAHHFLDKEELVEWLSKDGDTDESEARALVQQVEERDYNPPRRERILEWQNQQEFLSVRTPTIRIPATCIGSWTSWTRSSRTSRITAKTRPPKRR